MVEKANKNITVYDTELIELNRKEYNKLATSLDDGYEVNKGRVQESVKHQLKNKGRIRLKKNDNVKLTTNSDGTGVLEMRVRKRLTDAQAATQTNTNIKSEKAAKILKNKAFTRGMVFLELYSLWGAGMKLHEDPNLKIK